MFRFRFIALKELYHILRDPRSLAIVFAMPVAMTFLYGYAINLDVDNVVLSIIDEDRSYASRDLAGRFYNSRYFSRPDRETDLSDPDKLLRSTSSSAVLLIRHGFASALERGEQFDLGLTVDGSDSALGAAVQNYADLALLGFLAARNPGPSSVPRVNISFQIKYNPDLKSSHFFVPGLVAIILMMICALLTSITIAREKETGTMEQLLTTPVKPYEILLGKLTPYIVIALMDGILVLAFAKFVFGVPFVGSHLVLLGFGLLYVSTSLSIGILISSLVGTQQLAMMFSMVVTMLPSVMLSGFIFPIKNMPALLRGISQIVPARYFLVIIRGIMLKGTGARILAGQGLFLLVLMAILLVIAVKRFSRQAA